jgi:hypothetical protein
MRNHPRPSKHTHTHTCTRESSRTDRRRKHPGCQTTSTNTAMHRIQTHITPFFTKRGTPPRKSPTPNPASTKDQSTHAKNIQTSTPPAAPPPTSPNKLTVLTYNERLNAHSRDVTAHRATPTRRDGAHGNTPAQGKRRRDGQGNAQRIHDLGGLLHFRGPPAGSDAIKEHLAVLGRATSHTTHALDDA